MIGTTLCLVAAAIWLIVALGRSVDGDTPGYERALIIMMLLVVLALT